VRCPAVVLHLHRKYFVRACTSRPEEFLNSRYSPSFLAAFRSSEVIIFLMGNLLEIEPELPRRFWWVKFHVLILVGDLKLLLCPGTCGITFVHVPWVSHFGARMNSSVYRTLVQIMVGSVAMRHPRSVLAVDAMRSLECVLEQFRKCAHLGDRADRPTKALVGRPVALISS
jgi:hypothetical protein